MKTRTLCTTVMAMLAFSTNASAVPITFDFTFDVFNRSITGTIEGLEDNGSGQAATQIIAEGVFDTYVFTSFRTNSFDVVNGEINAFSLGLWTNSEVSVSGNFAADLSLSSAFVPYLREEGRVNSEFYLSEGRSRSVSFSSAPPSAVTLPASGILVFSGIICLVGQRFRMA